MKERPVIPRLDAPSLSLYLIVLFLFCTGMSFAYDDLVGGLIVTKAEGAALQAGVQAGDSVMEVNGDLLPEECTEDDLFDLLTEKPRPVSIGFWRSRDSPPASTESLGISDTAKTPEGPLSAKSGKATPSPAHATPETMGTTKETAADDKNAASAKSKDQPTPSTSSTWNCAVCKRENVASSLACSVCYTKKSGANKKPSAAKPTVNSNKTPAAEESVTDDTSVRSSSPIEVNENDTSVSSAMSPETAELMQMAAEIKSQVNAAGTLTAMKEMTEHYRKAETNDRQRVRLARRFEEDSGKKEAPANNAVSPEATASNLGADFDGVATVNEGAKTAPLFKSQDKKASKQPLKVDTAGNVSVMKTQDLKKVTPSSRSTSPAAAPAWAALQLKKTSKSSPDDKSEKPKESNPSDKSTPTYNALLKKVKVNPDEKSMDSRNDTPSAESELAFKNNLKKVNPDEKLAKPKEDTSSDASTPAFKANLKKVNPDEKPEKPKEDTSSDASTPVFKANLKKVNPDEKHEKPKEDTSSDASTPAFKANLKKVNPDEKPEKPKEDTSSDASTPVFKANLKKVNPDEKPEKPKEDTSSDASTPAFKANLKKVNPDEKPEKPKEDTSSDASTPAFKANLKKVNPDGSAKLETPVDDNAISPTAGLKKVSSNDNLATSPEAKEPIAYIAIKERLRKVIPGSGVDARPEPTKKNPAKAKSFLSRGLGRGPLSADKGPPPATSSLGRRRSGGGSNSSSSDNSDRTSSTGSVSTGSVSTGSVSGKSVPSTSGPPLSSGLKDTGSTNASPPAAPAPAAATLKKGGFFGGLKKRAESATAKASAAKSMLSPAKPAFASVTLKKTKSSQPKGGEEKEHDPDFGASASWLPPLDVGPFPPQDGLGMIWDRMREVVAADGGDGKR